MNIWVPTRANPTDYFTEEEVARSKAYQRPLRCARIVSLLVNSAVIGAFAGLRAGPRLIDSAGITAWPFSILVVGSALIVALMVAGLPVSAYRTFKHERKWGFSTQSSRLWVIDRIKGLIIGLILGNLVFLALWWVIRTTKLWWVLGALVLAAFALIATFIGPVVLLPLFNKLTPAEDEGLRIRLRDLARSGGVDISDVMVMDASRRTRHDNAFFTGIGKTKRVVIFDNMVDWEPETVDVVVAHEIGHWRHRHIIRGIAVATLTSFLVFVAMRGVMSWEGALRWAGVQDVRDPGALPLFMLAFFAGGLVTGWIDNWFSRGQERQADLFALDLTQNQAAFSRVWREFASKDLPDLAPSWWSRVNATHPPIAQRIAFGERWAAGTPRHI